MIQRNSRAAFLAAALLLAASSPVLGGWQWVTTVDANSFISPYSKPSILALIDPNTYYSGTRANDNRVPVDLSNPANINPFVLALIDPNAYLAYYGIDPDILGQTSAGSNLASDAITPLGAPLGGANQPIPEPASMAFLLAGLPAMLPALKRKGKS